MLNMPTNLPPGLEGHPYLYLLTVFSMLFTVLLALEWLWRTVWAFVERPWPSKHPATVSRLVFLFLMVGVLVRIGPDVWLLMRWPNMTPAGRAAVTLIDVRLDSTSFVFMGLAWLGARLGSPVIEFQLEKRPLPVNLWPTARQMRRPLYIGTGVFAIAFALTFLR